MKLFNRRLLLALAVSFAAHFLLVSGADFSLPELNSEETIHVTLAPPPVPKPLPLPAPRKEVPKPAVHHQPLPKPVEPPKPEVTQKLPPESLPVAVAEVPIQEAVPVAVPEVESLPAPPPEEPVVVPPAPRKVDMDYQILRNGSVGRVKRSFIVEGENRYVLNSVAEATGLVSLFYTGKYEEHSEGLVTVRGLQPQSYRLKRGSGKTQVATFDWSTHTVALDSGSNHAVVPVADGTQDMLSFLYQFMFVPPLDEMLITVANGRKLKTYAYDFAGEEQVDTRMGKLRTFHIAKAVADSDDKMEIWLAADYRYLPVKIRQTEKDGTVTELLATSLTMEDNQ